MKPRKHTHLLGSRSVGSPSKPPGSLLTLNPAQTLPGSLLASAVMQLRFLSYRAGGHVACTVFGVGGRGHRLATWVHSTSQHTFCSRQKIFADSGKPHLERKPASSTVSGNLIQKEALREWEGTWRAPRDRAECWDAVCCVLTGTFKSVIPRSVYCLTLKPFY